MISGAQAMVRALETEQVTTVFGYPGAAICPFYDALLDSAIKHVLTRHEQAAAHAANGYARATGRTGVCIATSGPGATNLITGIATAYMDSIPMVVITGQVSTDLIGSDSFQEADITGAASPFTKHTYLVRQAQDLPRIFREAFYIAASGRPGPVLVDIPMDIQTDLFTYVAPGPPDLPGYRPVTTVSESSLNELAALLASSGKPIICAGGGVISSGASASLLKIAERHQIPVVTTMMGIGALPSDHVNNLGTLGSHGVFAANYALHQADLVILAGARVGNRAMGSAADIARRAKIVHIDIDPAEIGKNIDTRLAVVADCHQFLDALLDKALPLSYPEWLAQVRTIRSESAYSNFSESASQTIHPPSLLRQLGRSCPPDTIVTTEVGQNQIWAANHYPIRQPRTFLSSGGMGTMGYGLPAALGAKIACPDRTVLAISGDGSLQMSLQELGTIRQEKAAVKIILLNNARLGMVHELQSLKYQRYSQVFLEENPDFSLLAAAYGFGYARLDSNDQAKAAVETMLSTDGPYLLECIVDPHEPTLYPRKKGS
jgi:acetolactate synthase I/II/III large subunit